MNRFHSSGTPSGNVEVMWTWKMIIPITAIVPIVPPLRDEQHERQRELDRRAEVRAERGRGARAAGPRGSAGTAWRLAGASGSTACC